MESLYRGHRFPPEIISHAVWLYHRFTLSFRDVEDLLRRMNLEPWVLVAPGLRFLRLPSAPLPLHCAKTVPTTT